MLRQRIQFTADGGHLRFVRHLPCVVTFTRLDVEAHHVKWTTHEYELLYGKPHAGQKRISDKWAVPLSAGEHRPALGRAPGTVSLHDMNEGDYWAWKCIDPVLLAVRLFEVTGDTAAAEQIVREFYLASLPRRRSLKDSLASL